MANGFYEKLSCLSAISLGLVLSQGCALFQRPPDQAPAPPSTKQKSAAPALLPQTGLASWYGAQHQGKQTASGTIFDQAALTAAHRSLPFGSKVKVTNLANGKSVEVEITDRGPFAENRIIDLSQAAAKALEMMESGTATVRIEQASGR
jgi:rare lipoprotein A